VSDELKRRTEQYAGHFPEAAASLPSRHRQMPYRAYLRLVAARLKATYDDHAFPYESPTELVADLELLADSLRANKGRNAGLFAVRRLLRRVRTFGFYLATVDVRQNALVHRRVIGEALQERNWLAADDEQRARRLEEALERRESPVGELSSEGRRTLAVFQTIAHCRRKYGRESIGPYIVSMAHGPDDVLSVLVLAKWGHLGSKGAAVPLDIAPMFETGEDVERAPRIMERLLKDKLYREHLRSRGDHQIVKLGYSDSHRDGGIAATRWSLQKAQQALVETVARYGVTLTIFHGRGGTVSRSGGAQHEAVLAAPRGAISGRLRMTEQGENINTKYGLRGIALRTLEQLLSAVLLVTVRPPPENPSEARWQAIMEEIAVASRGAYQSLLSDPDDFMEYFRAATPIDVIERIGSRSERAEHVADSVTEPRAAPVDVRLDAEPLPAAELVRRRDGLKKAIDVHGEACSSRCSSSGTFFRVLLSDVATALAKGRPRRRGTLLAARRRAAREVFPRDSARVSQLRRLDPAAHSPERAARGVAHVAACDSFAQPLRRSDQLPAGGSARALARGRPRGRRGPASADGEHQRHRARDAGHGLGAVARGAAPQRRCLDPANDASLELIGGHVALRERAAAYGDAGAMHRACITGNERVPPIEILAGRDLAIRARRRQPSERVLVGGVERDAVGDELEAARIAAAAATVAIEQLASHVRVRDLARGFVLQLLQAAPSAAVAERLPLFARQLGELLASPNGCGSIASL
jgi:hypothetical protein